MGGGENAKNVENAEAKTELTYESLVDELSKEKKESLKNKEIAERYQFENEKEKKLAGRLKEALVSGVSKNNELEARQKELEEELYNAKKQIMTENYRQRFLKLDISEPEARRLAEAVFLGDTDKLVDGLEKELKRIKACFLEEARSEFLTNRSDWHCGNGDIGKNSLAMQMAERYIADKSRTVDEEMLKNFM